MERIGKSKSDGVYLIALGRQIESLIKKRGYKSIYEFWIEKAGDKISRASLNKIVRGQTDVKICTLRTIAQLLRVTLQDLVDIEN